MIQHPTLTTTTTMSTPLTPARPNLASHLMITSGFANDGKKRERDIEREFHYEPLREDAQITWSCETSRLSEKKSDPFHSSLIDATTLTFLLSFPRHTYLSAGAAGRRETPLFDAVCRPSERDPIFQMSLRQKNLWIRIEVVSRSRPTDDDVIIYLLRRRLLCICMIVSFRSAIILAAAAAATVESLCFRIETNKVQTRKNSAAARRHVCSKSAS